MKKGKLVVIEGMDGAGKATQADLLKRRLSVAGYHAELISFPVYKLMSSASIHTYLRGVREHPDRIHPYVASVHYAVNRHDFSYDLAEWLAEGKIVIADRYVASNGGHQGGKIKDDKEREQYLQWLYDLEYNKFGIPRPDINIFLDVPLEISLANIEKRGNEKDGHENREHLANARLAYHFMVNAFPADFVVINCVDDGGNLLLEGEIHEKVWNTAKNVLGLS